MHDFVKEILGGNEADLTRTLDRIRKKEFNYAVNALKQDLKSQQRCIVCTLKVPCPHFAYPEDIPTVPLPSVQEFSLHKYTEGLDIDALKLTVVSAPNDERKRFAVRFKEGKNAYVMSHSPRYRHAVPSTQKLHTLEQVEEYKERKLKKELEKIEETKKQEERERRSKSLTEEKRLRRAQKLKEKLERFNEDVSRKQADLDEERKEMVKRQKLKEEKHKQYLEEQKKKLAEYHEKRKPNEKKKEVKEASVKFDHKKIYMNS